MMVIAKTRPTFKCNCKNCRKEIVDKLAYRVQLGFDINLILCPDCLSSLNVLSSITLKEKTTADHFALDNGQVY